MTGGAARAAAAMLAMLATLALLAALPAEARSHRARAGHGRHAAAVPYPRPWGTTVYGSSLPFVDGSCVDPYDPDPIGGPDRVGEGGPGGYGPQCRTQAGVVPGTTVR